MAADPNHPQTFRTAAAGEAHPRPVHSTKRRDWSAFKADLEELAAAIRDPETPTGPVWIKRQAIDIATRHRSLFDTVIRHVRRILETEYDRPERQVD